MCPGIIKTDFVIADEIGFVILSKMCYNYCAEDGKFITVFIKIRNELDGTNRKFCFENDGEKRQ